MPMTLAELLALLPDNTTGDIGADDMRTVTTELYNQPPAILHSNLLATKVWSGSAYVWPGTTAPDANAYTNIVFIDPAGTHDPKTSTGGRDVANDLWETGTVSGGGGTTDRGLWAASTAYNAGDVVTYGSCRFQRLTTGFTSGATFDPSNWMPFDRLDVDNPASWTAANAADYEFDGSGSTLPSGWTWVNQGTSTYSEATGVGTVGAVPAASNAFRAVVRAVPGGATWTATVKVAASLVGGGTSVNGAGLVLYENATGKAVTFLHYFCGGATQFNQVAVTNWSSPTAAVGNISGPTYASGGPGVAYLRIRRNSATSWDFGESVDGVTWSDFAPAVNLTSYFTTAPDRIGFAGRLESSFCSFGCHWMRFR